MRRIKITAVLAMSVSVLITSCSGSKRIEKEDAAAVTQVYTCPMHPQVVKNEMGTCPICAMDLVVFEKSDSKSLVLDSQRQLLANVTTVAFGSAQASAATKVFNGRLVASPEQTTFVSAKIGGRVERLYVKEIGLSVKKGQPLYQIYSEQLAALQQEYLMALAQQKAFANDKVEQQLLAAAKQKLLLYGQTEMQLKQLQNGRQKSALVTVFAEASGTLSELLISEGVYVAEGASVMRLENLQKLWVEVDVFAGEAKLLKTGSLLKFLVAGYEQDLQQMKVEFVSPVLVGNTQLVQVRGSILNGNSTWQPGLQVQVFMDGNNKATSENFLPVDAVVKDAKGAHVWVKTAKDTFEPRRVEVGLDDKDLIVIKSGLFAGEEVVVTGAYLLFSEYVLKRGKHPILR